MSVTLPNATDANTESTAVDNAAITDAQNAFIANATVLINQAIQNGIFYVQPFITPLVTADFVNGYFQPLGYTVLFPVVPNYPYNPAFVPGFPEVLPPGYQEPLYNPVNGTGPPRCQISWGPVPTIPFPQVLPPADW